MANDKCGQRTLRLFLMVSTFLQSNCSLCNCPTRVLVNGEVRSGGRQVSRIASRIALVRVCPKAAVAVQDSAGQEVAIGQKSRWRCGVSREKMTEIVASVLKFTKIVDMVGHSSVPFPLEI